MAGADSPAPSSGVGECIETSKMEEPETFCLEAAGTVETAQVAFLQIAQAVQAGRGHVKVKCKPARVMGSNHGVVIHMHCGKQG